MKQGITVPDSVRRGILAMLSGTDVELKCIAQRYSVHVTTVARLNRQAGFPRRGTARGYHVWKCPMCGHEQMTLRDNIPGCPRCTEEEACAS